MRGGGEQAEVMRASRKRLAPRIGSDLSEIFASLDAIRAASCLTLFGMFPQRRASHNAVERERRETLNARFLDLAAFLPNLKYLRRPSKSAIVGPGTPRRRAPVLREPACEEPLLLSHPYAKPPTPTPTPPTPSFTPSPPHHQQHLNASTPPHQQQHLNTPPSVAAPLEAPSPFDASTQWPFVPQGQMW
ncbi:hypothetical protein C8R44DRAFT_987317 [Mycena epipterygia]|nr:hypothetical protein C8R44DRAFT_987317 [Mycena epipterygia]